MRGAILYQGLFLIALALYADARLHPVIPAGEGTVHPVPEAKQDESAERLPLALDLLKQELEQMPVFKAKIPGVRFEARPDQIRIEFEGRDLYRENAVEVDAIWHKALEQIGIAVYGHLDPELTLEITGFGTPAEGQAPGQGELRARWMEQFFEARFGGTGKAHVKLKDGGSPAEGRQRLEFRCTPN
ncbi:MAG: hypothetical protein EBX52_09500 [Proteobacteria bacterium]|nr:hypothetical protein [Pseudomonadota bacterium]